MKRIALLLVPVLLAAGCGSETPEARTETRSPFADCAALTAPPPAAPAESSTAEPGTEPAPDLELPCFTGGQAVEVSAIRGPAVVNLWASWCLPCRKELPVVQRFANRTAGKVHVIGVNTRDDREAAIGLAQDFDLTIPSLFDPGERLWVEVEARGLPATLFIDGQGQVRYLYNSEALDDATLASLAARYLGVTSS